MFIWNGLMPVGLSLNKLITMKQICNLISKVTFGKVCFGWCKK